MTALLKKIVNIIEPPKFVPSRYGRKHTPDILVLEQFEKHLVFTPCDLRKGGNHHHFLKDAKPYDIGYTRKKFVTYVKDLGKESFPIHLPANEGQRYSPKEPPALSVRGELWQVSPETLAEKLDNYKLNGVEFTRQMVEIKFPYRAPYRSTDRDTWVTCTLYTNEMTYMLRAWMYIGIEEYWNEQIDNGYLFKRCPSYTSRKKGYEGEIYEFK